MLVLGTFHMRSTPDMYKTEIDNLLSQKRQQEIQEVVDRLKKYKPTKIALEVETKLNERINLQFRQFKTGNFELEVNEVHQVGFRIAADLLHKEIYAIDWMEQGAGTRSVGEIYEWTKAHQPELFHSIFGWIQTKHGTNEANKYKSILDMYRDCNEIAEIRQLHAMNINIARIGYIDQYIGMDWLIWWYQRNLILFSNVARIATSKDDRILLIIGGSHVQILNQFFAESDLFELDNIQNYIY